MPQHRPLCATTCAPHQAATITLHQVLGWHVVLLDLMRWRRGVLSPCAPFHRCRVHAIWAASNPTCDGVSLHSDCFLCHTETVEFHIISGTWLPLSPLLWSSHSISVIVNVKSCLSSASSDALTDLGLAIINNRGFVGKGMLNVLNWKYKWGLLLHCIICKISLADTGGCSSAWPVLRSTSVSQLWCPGSLLHCRECIPWTNCFLKKTPLFYVYVWIPEWICIPCECRYP